MGGVDNNYKLTPNRQTEFVITEELGSPPLACGQFTWGKIRHEFHELHQFQTFIRENSCHSWLKIANNTWGGDYLSFDLWFIIWERSTA